MNEKDKLQPKRPPEDMPTPANKPKPAIPGKAPISPPKQAANMEIKAEIERQRQAMGKGPAIQQAPKPMPTPAAPAVIKHVWTKEDTYADLAFKYYGSIKEPYWRLIYNHNKKIIGNHPNDIRVGLEIEIPPLPPELAKK